MGKKIGSIFSQSAYTPATIIIGSNGSVTRDWADVLYDFFLLKVNSQNKKDIYHNKNIQFQNGISSTHVHVFRQRSTGKHGRSTTLTDYIDTMAFELYSTELTSGGLMSDTIEFLVAEMKRIFMRYYTYSIAGIHIIDNIVAGEPIPPESEANPFQGVYKCVVTIDIYYTEQFLYPLTEEWELTHQGGRYSAGSFVEEIEDPLQIP